MKTEGILLLIAVIKCMQAARVGDSCTIQKGRGSGPGICKEVRQCPVVLENWRKHSVKPTLCDEVTRIICCPLPTTLKPRGSPTRDRVSSHSELYFYRSNV